MNNFEQTKYAKTQKILEDGRQQLATCPSQQLSFASLS